jgi:hypothetical protein
MAANTIDYGEPKAVKEDRHDFNRQQDYTYVKYTAMLTTPFSETGIARLLLA